MSMRGKLDTALLQRARKVIPNGMYGHEAVDLLPDGCPQFFSRAEGAHLWDADGNRYLDFLCAYGPNLFGYHNKAIDDAAARQRRDGDTMTGPSAVMVDLAEALVSMVSHADWAMFCKNGSDATGMALMTARAHTGRRIVLVAEGAYHGATAWCTPGPKGVLPEDRAHVRTYAYNDTASLETAVYAAGDDLAAIFASPFKHDVFVDQELPDPAYARRARELCDQTGALLIIDEVRGGFRVAKDASWSLVDVKPDLSCWGKAVANGQPLSILLGSEKAREAAGSIYVTGSFWFSAVPMAAAIETLRIIRDTDYIAHLVTLGDRLREGLDEAARRHGYKLRQSGPVQMPLIMIADDPDLRFGYAWVQEMLARGVYMHPWHNMFLCTAMTMEDIEYTITSAEDAFATLNEKLDEIRPSPALLAMISQHASSTEHAS